MTGYIILLMYDIPSKTKMEKKEYRRFVKYLERNGFVAIQESIKIKFIRNKDTFHRFKWKIENVISEDFNVIIWCFTLRSFNKMIRFGNSSIDMEVITSNILYL